MNNHAQGRSTEELTEIAVKALARELDDVDEEEARAMIERVRTEASQHWRRRKPPIVLPEQRDCMIYLDNGVPVYGKAE